jgi:DNA-binding transcriptional ArsR family regulator
MTTATTTVDTDTALLLLADRTRRTVLRSLIETGGDTAVEELVETIATRELSTGGETLLAGGGRVAVELHHVHLPKLREAGLIEYDARNDAVRYRPGDLVEDLLGVLDAYDDPG